MLPPNLARALAKGTVISCFVTISNADIGSLKSLHTLFDKYLDHMLVILEQNCIVRSIEAYR